MRSYALFLAACLTLAACDSNDAANEAATDSTAATKPGTEVVYAEQADTAMNRAIAQARATIGEFEQVLEAPDTTQKNFAVKVELPHPGGTEHIWLNKPELEQDSVVGSVESQPVYVTAVRAGQRVRVGRAHISDWMYMESGKLRGGYTMRISLENLPDKQRDAHKKALGIE